MRGGRTNTQKHAQRGCVHMCAMCAVVRLFRGKNTRCVRRKREIKEDKEIKAREKEGKPPPPQRGLGVGWREIKARK